MSVRHTNLDMVRGTAILGILLMNAVIFGIGMDAYFEITKGNATGLDWVIGAAGEILIDQKFMGLFSLLFGASAALFMDRAQAKGSTSKQAARLSLKRNALLMGIGAIHSVFWVGDILLLYAICSLPLILMRNVTPRTLMIAGVGVFLSAIPMAVGMDALLIEAALEGASPKDLEDLFSLAIAVDGFARALGMMMLGMGMYRRGLLTDTEWIARRRWAALGGLVLAWALAASGWAWTVFGGSERTLLANIPNTLATIPATLGYMVGLFWLDARFSNSALVGRLRSVGRMALTNYLMQTALGLTVFGVLGVQAGGRTGVLVFVVCVWAFQLAASPPWLERHVYGPIEWLWRAATYGRWPAWRRVR